MAFKFFSSQNCDEAGRSAIKFEFFLIYSIVGQFVGFFMGMIQFFLTFFFISLCLITIYAASKRSQRSISIFLVLSSLYLLTILSFEIIYFTDRTVYDDYILVSSSSSSSSFFSIRTPSILNEPPPTQNIYKKDQKNKNNNPYLQGHVKSSLVSSQSSNFTQKSGTFQMKSYDRPFLHAIRFVGIVFIVICMKRGKKTHHLLGLSKTPNPYDSGTQIRYELIPGSEDTSQVEERESGDEEHTEFGEENLWKKKKKLIEKGPTCICCTFMQESNQLDQIYC